MSTTTGLFRNAAEKDDLDIHDEGAPRHEKVAKFLAFGNREIAQAAGVPVSKIRLDAKIPPGLAERFRGWGVVLNLVARFLEGNADKTALWFSLPIRMLGNVSPRDMLRVGRFRRLHPFIVDALAENAPPDPRP